MINLINIYKSLSKLKKNKNKIYALNKNTGFQNQ
jgi:hypothetical protein